LDVISVRCLGSRLARTILNSDVPWAINDVAAERRVINQLFSDQGPGRRRAPVVLIHFSHQSVAVKEGISLSDQVRRRVCKSRTHTALCDRKSNGAAVAGESSAVVARLHLLQQGSTNGALIDAPRRFID